MRLLEDSWKKLSRAQTHADALQKEGSTFEKSDAVGIVGDTNGQAGDQVIRLSLKEEPPLDKWGLIIGDILHNLHSALECLAWQLAIVHYGREPTDSEAKNIYFPLVKNPEAFRSHRIMPYITETHRKMLADVQPYQRGYEILSTLVILSNHDKHRIINPTFLVSDEFIIDVRPVRDGEVLRIVLEEPGPFVDGRKLARVQVRETGPKAEFENYCDLSAYIALGNGTPIQEVVSETRMLVEGILKDFEPTLSAHLL